MRYVLTGILLLIGFWSSAQTMISGRLVNAKNKGINGVSITLEGTYDGATSDQQGKYSFTTSEKGAQKLVFAMKGYDTLAIPITIQASNIYIDTTLKPSKEAMNEVVIISRNFTAGTGKNVVMSSQDIYTTGGANGDISQALRNLPGTQQLGEREGLAVRGGDVYETKQFIDGSMVGHPYYSAATNIPSRTRYPPSLFKDVAFSTGGYSALYGQALSSALVLETIDIPEKSEANASITPLFWGGGLQKVNKTKTASWGMDYSYTNVGLYFKLVKQTPDYFKMPQYHSVDGNFRFKTKNGGIVKYYGTFDYNQLGLRRQSVDSLALKNAFYLKGTNTYHNLSWRQPLSNNWKLNAVLSFSNNHNDIWQQLQDSSNTAFPITHSYWDTLNFTLRNNDLFAQGKVVLEKKFVGQNALRFGAEYWYNKYGITYNDYDNTLKDNYTAGFAETDIYLARQLALQTGIRFENSSLLGKSDIAPRASLAYKFAPKNQVSASYGLFYQKPENMYLVRNQKLDMTQASHYILTYIYQGQKTMLRLEGYYKDYKDLVKTYPDYNNSGNGYAKGFDLYWRDNGKTIKDVDYWVTYSYIDSKRNYLNFPTQMQPNFVANHTFNLVVKKFFPSISTGISPTFNFATGRPYYNLLLTDKNNAGYTITDQGKTKQYQMLNVSAYHLMKIGKGFGVLYASMTNVLNRNNIFGYQYGVDGQNKMPVLPTAKRFYFIALFISWGVDRSQDTINGNL
ncbi:MAG: TonB-dependent receptor [Chitinophagaceae bacterium]